MDNIKINSKASHFTISTAFVDRFMKDAHPSFVKVYIYIARHALESAELSLEKIAEDTGLIKSDVVTAFKYWNKVGVVSYDASGLTLLPFDGETVSVSNRNETSQAFEPEKKIKKQSTSVASSYKGTEVVKTVTSNQALSQFFAIIGQLLNKPLSTNDYKVIYSFIDYLKLPEQVIIMLFEYCISIGKTNMRYIEKIAYAWADEGIVTPELAEGYVKRNTEERDVLKRYKKSFKITGRDFTDTETKMLTGWINDLKASEELIMYAYDKAVMNTGKISFQYMDSVIRGELAGKTAPDKKPLESNIRKSTFRNYPQDDKMGDIEREMIKKMMANSGGDGNAINE